MKTFAQLRQELNEGKNPPTLKVNDAKKLLQVNGFVLDRHGNEHDVYSHPQKGKFQLPRHKTISPGVTSKLYKLLGV